MKEPPDIAQLVKACQKGKRQAQHTLYKKYYGRYYALCNRYIRDDFTTQAVVNEGFYRVFTHVKKLRQPELFEGWMKRIFINTCLEELKKKQLLFTEIDDSFDSENNIYDTNLAPSHLAMDELLELVQQLPHQMRTVFNLYVIDGFNHKEIAAQLQISEGTSKFHLSKAREWLQSRVLFQQGELSNPNDYERHV